VRFLQQQGFAAPHTPPNWPTKRDPGSAGGAEK
jgi:hypothetical protein